jgi:diadenosine tetraphosphate (Ap4A) HIT family hydrolase
MEDCIFCRIIADKEPASRVYEDDYVVAFMDLVPVNPGHTLVVPRRHASELRELDLEDGARMFSAGHRLSVALRESGVRCDGVNLRINDGDAAGQDVFHVHLHIIPRIYGDGFGGRRPPGYGVRASREELDALAKQIRAALPD